MRSLAINYQILLGSLDNTIRFSLSPLNGVVTLRGPSNWGLGTKDTQTHTYIPLAFWHNSSLWTNPLTPLIGLRGGRQGVYSNGQQEIAYRGWSRYGK